MFDPQLRTVTANGVTLAYFERGAPEPGRPTLVFVHATGFHGRIWDRIADSFGGFHIVAYEHRGHGRSERQAIDHWKTFGEDLAACAVALGLSNAIGIGHSVGAHALVDAAATVDAFAQLVLLDPTIISPDAYSAALRPDFPDGGHPATKRRRYFASAQDMYKRLKDKGSFPKFEPRILKDYCDYGLLPSENGGFELACSPETEAAVYMSARTNGAIYDAVRRFDRPVHILRAREPQGERRGGMDFESSPTWPNLVNEFPMGTEQHLRDCSHFIPMEAPDVVVDAIRRTIEKWPAVASDYASDG